MPQSYSRNSWLEHLFRLDDKGWARHMNPWSVYTRFGALPLLALAAWSRVWWGLPVSLAGLALVALAIWLNPRLFPPASSSKAWGTRGVLGERIWLASRQSDPAVKIPQEFRRSAIILNAINSLGFVGLVYALVVLDWRLALAGGLTSMLAKAWFLDRMVWLYDWAAEQTPDLAKTVNPLSPEEQKAT
jgi:ABC-type multidrug transport system fused ATPase/permease subunit